jgi:hypothetical protein
MDITIANEKRGVGGEKKSEKEGGPQERGCVDRATPSEHREGEKTAPSVYPDSPFPPK